MSFDLLLLFDDGVVADVFCRSYDTLSSKFAVVKGEGRLFRDYLIEVVADDDGLAIDVDDWAFFSLLLTLLLSSLSEATGLEANTMTNSTAHTIFPLSFCCSEVIGNH